MTRRTLTSAELTIDLGALVDNYRTVLDELDGVPAAAMIKADAYGLGAQQVGQALASAGCHTFMVAHMEEGIELRSVLAGADIHVLSGAIAGTEAGLVENDLTPVLNSLAQLDCWQRLARDLDRLLLATLHFDTGMSRLGFPDDEAEQLLMNPSLMHGIEVRHVMSHLASADDPESDQSETQRVAFADIRSRFPAASASLANSAGIFRGPEFHFDLGRPGIALYGGSPVDGGANPMKAVATLEAPILQVRNTEAGDTVGYGATHVVDRPGRLATLAIGYADGFLRSGSGDAMVQVGGRSVPVVGRVSMDMVTVDVTDVPDSELYLGAPVEVMGSRQLVDDVASRAGTIAYEILTGLGSRFAVDYIH